jgi:hypothetical protein
MGDRVVFLLEDDPARLQPMLEVLRSVLSQHRVHVEDDAGRAIAWLSDHQGYVELISLDHDLDSVPRQEDPPADHGCGRDVSRFLASREPTCPVIVHTTNATAGTDMVLDLQRSKWPVFRVYPFDEHAWVGKNWLAMLKKLAIRGYLDP